MTLGKALSRGHRSVSNRKHAGQRPSPTLRSEKTRAGCGHPCPRRETCMLLPNNQRQHRTSHAQKYVMPLRIRQRERCGERPSPTPADFVTTSVRRLPSVRLPPYVLHPQPFFFVMSPPPRDRQGFCKRPSLAIFPCHSYHAHVDGFVWGLTFET